MRNVKQNGFSEEVLKKGFAAGFYPEVRLNGEIRICEIK
jgi:hypothetical protein